MQNINSQTMRAVFATSPGKLEIREVPIPVPELGEVLIKVNCFPIHTLECSKFNSKLELEQEYPFQLGIEGAGTVVKTGGGWHAWWLQGRRVIFCPLNHSAWGEYTVCNARMCEELPKEVSFEMGCVTLNAYIVTILIEKAIEIGCKCIIQTAAFSQNGKIMIRACKEEGIKSISIVRKEEQISILQEMGGDIVLNSEDLYFWDKLKVAIDNMEATVLVDYVGGNIGGKILKIMPEKSVMFPCSVLSKYCEGEIDILDLMLKGKEVQGFNVVSYSLSAQPSDLKKFNKKILTNLDTIYRIDVNKILPMDKIQEACEEYLENFSKGKIIIKVCENS